MSLLREGFTWEKYKELWSSSSSSLVSVAYMWSHVSPEQLYVMAARPTMPSMVRSRAEAQLERESAVQVAASLGVGNGSEVSSSGRRSGERRLAFGSARMDLWPVLEAQLNKEVVEPEPEEAKSAPEQAPAPVVAAFVAAPEAAPPPPPKVTVFEEEQWQVLQWILEEKRKLKA